MAQTHQAVKRQEATQIAECNLMGIAHTRMSIRLTPCPGVTRESPGKMQRLDPPDVSAPKGTPGGWGSGEKHHAPSARKYSRAGHSPGMDHESYRHVDRLTAASGYLVRYFPLALRRSPRDRAVGGKEGPGTAPLTPPRGGFCMQQRKGRMTTSHATKAENHISCNKRQAVYPHQKRAP